MLHFPDTSHGLCKLYFLDPVWLSECLERIIHLKSSRSVARNGVIRAEDLRMLLVGTGFTEQTEEQYFQFLAKFEIALPVASDSTAVTLGHCWTENRPPTKPIQCPVGSVLWAESCGQHPVPPNEGLEDDQHCTVQQQMSYRL
ncbi:hypothetical protein NFI96_008639 [Prochilodus magdalenae]|nr:hypothetical protein NFI96_008639 [Prochilodus magdalenae]